MLVVIAGKETASSTHEYVLDLFVLLDLLVFAEVLDRGEEFLCDRCSRRKVLRNLIASGNKKKVFKLF